MGSPFYARRRLYCRRPARSPCDDTAFWNDKIEPNTEPAPMRTPMLNEREIESCYLGQFIPVHYHHNMLMDQNRMHGFKSAIDYAVKPGMKVLELGGGTGALVRGIRGDDLAKMKAVSDHFKEGDLVGFAAGGGAGNQPARLAKLTKAAAPARAEAAAASQPACPPPMTMTSNFSMGGGT